MEKIIEQIKTIEDKKELNRLYRHYDNLLYETEVEEIKKDIGWIKLNIQSKLFEIRERTKNKVYNLLWNYDKK